MKHRYTLAALAALALVGLLPAEAARYWLASDVVKNTTPSNARGYANTLTLTSDDPENDPVSPIVITDVRQIDNAGTSRQLRKIARDNGTAPFAGCAYGGVDLDLTLPIRDAEGNKFTLVELANESFQDNLYIGSVKFPASLTTIGQYSFRRCYYLREFTFPADTSALTNIGNAVFDNCNQLKFAEWPTTVGVLPGWTFNGATGLIGFYGASVTNVGEAAFNTCTSLKTVEFGKGIEFTARNVCQNVDRNTRQKIFFRTGAPVVNVHFTGYDGTSGTEGNTVFDWLSFGGVDFYIPLNATGDGPTAEWEKFKSDFLANEANTTFENTVEWPTDNGDGTWTPGVIKSGRQGGRTGAIYYWDPSESTTAALLAY